MGNDRNRGLAEKKSQVVSRIKKLISAPFASSLSSKPSRARLLLAFFILLLTGVASFWNVPAFGESARKNGSAGAPADIALTPRGYPFTFIAYGDIRFTDPSDTEASNATLRTALVERIAQEKPEFLVLTGDLVMRGDDLKDWDAFDQETKPLRNANLEIFPALGNHDLEGSEAKALANYFQRFPHLQQRRWYSVRYGNCYLLILDSESDVLRGSVQWRWLEAQLDQLPEEIDFVFVVLHHPPFTRSSKHAPDGGHSARGQEKRLGRMIEGRAKGMRAQVIVIAGHIHNYERYERNGLMYVVTGGGGAEPYLPKRFPKDFYTQPGPTYHYCKLTIDQQKLRFEMVKLEGDGRDARWRVEDSFEWRVKRKGRRER